MSQLPEQILKALEQQPNQKAAELASLLDVPRGDINKALYGALKGKVVQDRSYRWSLASERARTIDDLEEDEAPHANTDLSRLCRYYLACLGYDDTGISTFLTSKYGDPDYIETGIIPRRSDDLSESEAGRVLLGRKRTERGRYGLYYGYPTYIRHVKSQKSDWEGYMVEPIFLFSMEQEKGSGRLTVDLSFPIINQKPFQSFTNAERDMLMNELVQLEHELGLTGDEGRTEIDEVAMRLQAVRPEWPWKEDIDPDELDDEERTPISEVNEQGIYNRAVIMMAEKSPFTQGLEQELRDLSQMREEQYAGTALGRWVKGEGSTEEDIEQLEEPLLEVLPMNSEQRSAVHAALTRPVTIITGPPGTGKSQVVTNMLVNAAWSGKRVLFASKNNKAVNVVETRVNSLGSRPILLRVGSQAYQVRLAEYVLSLLSSTTTESEREDFEQAKEGHQRLLDQHTRLHEEMDRFVALRNELDRKEQQAEEARQVLGADLFKEVKGLSANQLRSEKAALYVATKAADPCKAGMISSFFWPLLRKARTTRLTSALDKAQPLFKALYIEAPKYSHVDDEISKVWDVLSELDEKLKALDQAIVYQSALEEFQSLRPLEDIAKEQVNIQERIAKNSEALWKLWLRLQPSKLSSAERQKLGKYTSLLKMVMEAGEDGQLSKQVYAKYSAMLKDISHLLPCWAVTSLSARGRIPLEPANFDIVVFDEASQCDIASAIPLLYRAKSVVIIGDPKQLSHISGLQKGQDQALLERYELMEDYPHWAYSHQSLFDLGATQVAGEDVVSLVDHHRSHADIINFSNQEFYEERLRVATKYNNLHFPNRAEPGIRWIDVKGKTIRPGSGGALNNKEAEAVVKTLRDLLMNKGYKGSVGVVTPFRAQANAITKAVNEDNELATHLAKHGFLADTVHKFQGDERDVMIFSPVVSSGAPSGALGFLRSNGNLFNVAITRARAQLLVVGDISACSNCDVGYLSRFASYASSLDEQAQEAIDNQIKEYGPKYPNVAKPELVSDWERDFYLAAYEQGFRLIPQYPVEKYIVDFLMVDGDRKLVIEIDGERYHRNWTGELCRRDQMRNQRLFELGYDVLRFWVYEVRDDLPRCLNRLKVWQTIKLVR